MDLLPRRPGSPPAREERGSRNRAGAGTEIGVTGGARTRGLQSHILAFSPPELTPPRTGASGWSRTSRVRRRRVYSASGSPLPMPMRNTIDDGPPCSRPAVGCRRRCRWLVPSGSPRACGSKAIHGPGCPSRANAGMKKTLPAAGSEGFGGKSPMIKWRYAAPSPFEPVARYSDPQGNRRAWPWPLASERLGALQASSIGCIRFDITRSHRSCGRGGGTRTPADAVLETAALAAELHLFRKPPNKKAASVSSGRLADLGLVVSRFKTSTSAPRRP